MFDRLMDQGFILGIQHVWGYTIYYQPFRIGVRQ